MSGFRFSIGLQVICIMYFGGHMRVLFNSTNIAEAFYQPTTKVLEIYFHSGHIYRYAGITQDTFDELLCAPSAGKFYNNHIRGQYTSLRWF